MYGSRDGRNREVRFSRFRTEKSLDNPYADLKLNALNRSGERYQLCYNLKTVVLNVVDNCKAIDKEWNIRQAFCYHQFDVDKATQLWLSGDPLCAVRRWVTEHRYTCREESSRPVW